ncbi:MAG: SLATT domain-containing protein [Archaeoglobaceae archaeon]
MTEREWLRMPANYKIGVIGIGESIGETVEGLWEVIESLDKELDNKLKNTPYSFTIVSPLASDTERYVIRELLASQHENSGLLEKIGIEVVLPLSRDEYMGGLDEKERDELKPILDAAQIKILKEEEGTDSYKQAGYYVVDNCDALVFISDETVEHELTQYAKKSGRYIFRIASGEQLKISEREKYSLKALEHLDTYNGEKVSEDAVDSDVNSKYDFLVDKASESGFSVEPLKNMKGNVMYHMARANLLARKYQDRYLRFGTAIYALAAAAIATVTIQVFFFPQHPELLWLEVVEMGIILALTATRSFQWHRRAVDYRFLADRLQAAIFLHIAGVKCLTPESPSHLNLSHRSGDWVMRSFEQVWSELPSVQPGSNLTSLKTFLVEGWINDQIDWYEKSGRKYSSRSRFLERLSGLLFVITLIAAILHASETFPHLFNVLTSAVIILPAIAASLAGIRHQREYKINAERYNNMGHHLTSARRQIIRADNRRSLVHVLERVNNLLLHENQDWRIVFLHQKLEPL